MEPSDRQAQIARYVKRLEEFGYSPLALDLGRDGRQDLRFPVLAGPALRDPHSSVLDVGCGFADLYDYLRGRGWQGRYTGLDIVPEFLELSRRRHPRLDLRLCDITDPGPDIDPHDYVIAASGVFNARLSEDNIVFIRKALKVMHGLARVAVSVDFLSTQVDFQKPEAWHTDPAWALKTARELSRRVVLRLDYMPYEFALILYTDDSISQRNAFAGFERSPEFGS